MAKRKWTIDYLRSAISESEGMTEVLKILKLKHSSHNSATIKKYIQELDINTSHWRGEINKPCRTYRETPIEDIFIQNSTYTRSHLKDKIIKFNLIKYACVKCNITNEWCNLPIMLQLDHINGISNDNRLENLRFLCPNCHSQTETFAGRNVATNKDKLLYICNKCGKYKSRASSGLCGACHSTQDKFNWPSDDDLKKMIEESNMFQTSKKLGVSNAAVRARVKKKQLL